MPAKREKPLPRRNGGPDDDNPEWTAADFASARPFSEVFPEQYAAMQDEQMERLNRPRGRPRKDTVKQNTTLRLDPEALALWRASGPGWQTRINALLQAHAPKKR